MGATGNQLDDVCLTIIKQNIYIMVAHQYIDPGGGGTDRHLILTEIYSTDLGSSWTEVERRDENILTTTSDQFLAHWVEMDGSIWCPFSSYEYLDAAYQVRFYKRGDTDYLSQPIDAPEEFYFGNVYNDAYYYMSLYSAVYVLRIFDGTPVSSTIQTGLVEPLSFNANVQLYWKFYNIEFLIDEDHFYVREGTGSWVSFVDSGTTTNGIVWKYDDYGNYVPAYIIWKDTIYWISKTNQPLSIQQTTVDAYVGWEDWFSNGADAIFQIELTDIEIQGDSMKVDRQILEGPRCTLISTIEPFQNQFIQIKDSTGFVHFQGKIIKYSKDLTDSTYEWMLKSLIEIDLDPDNKITNSYDTKTFPFILDDFLTNYAKGLWHGKGTNALVTDFTSAFITANKTEGTGCTVTLGTTNYFLNGKMDNAAILYDNGAGTAALDIPSISGTTVVSFSIVTTDITKGTTIEVYEGATRIGYILIDTSTVYWYDGVAEQDLTITTVNNTIIHIALVFSAANDDVDIYVDGVSNSTQDLENAITTEISKLTIVTNAADTGYYSYIAEYYLGNSIVEALNTYDSISPLLTATYTKNPKSQNFRSLCKEIMRTTGYIITWTNEDQLYLDQYRPSTYHITDNNFISAGKPTVENEPYSSVKIFGGFVNGSQLEAKKDSDPTLNPIFDWFPLIEDQTELDTKVAQMATDLNVKITKLNPILYNIPFLQMGEYITITSTAYGYTASTGWLVCYLSSQPTHNIITPALSDVFYQGSKKTTDSDRVVNNEQNIAAAANDIQTNVTDITTLRSYFHIGSANSGFIPCAYEATSEPGKLRQSNGISNVDGTDQNLRYMCPLPTTLGSLKLYIASATVAMYDADANDYLDRFRIVGTQSNVNTTEVDDGTNRTTVGTKTYSFTDFDASGYQMLFCWLNIVCTTANEVEIGSVRLEYYYDT